jgi:hypothetical protein
MPVYKSKRPGAGGPFATREESREGSIMARQLARAVNIS